MSALVSLSGAGAVLVQGAHPFERHSRNAIAQSWKARHAANPALYNGRTVLAASWSLEGGTFSAVCHEVGYATLLHWLATPVSEGGIEALHFYAAPAIISADGMAIMGRMAGHTANAGRVYFPSGSLEKQDFRDGLADLPGNMQREVLEETGLDLNEAEAGEGYQLWQGRGVAALIRSYRFREDAVTLHGRMTDFCRSERSDGELEDILVFKPGQSDPAMPAAMQAWIGQFAG